MFISFVFMRCKKSTLIQPENIVGTWHWVATYAIYPLGPNNPLTPQNTGTQQTLIFNTDKTYKWLKNNTTFDSGTYSIGHGTYISYNGTSKFIYDSIRYFHNGTAVNEGIDYYKIQSNDTLNINGGWGDQLGGCYTTRPYNGSGIWLKQ